MFEEIIKDCKGYIERNGFIFTCVTHPANIYDALYIRNVKNDNLVFRNFPMVNTSLSDHIQLVNNYELRKASIFADDLEFIKDTPSLKHLFLTIDYDDNKIDYSSLYEMSEIKSLVINNINFGPLKNPVDYSKIEGLEFVNIAENGHLNYEKISTLKSLRTGIWKNFDLKGLFTSKRLDTLQMIQCGMTSLDGIEYSDNMQCVYLNYNRHLQDISALKNVKDTLKALRIENCPKITDFSVLSDLDNLELLELTGKNELSDLTFIKKMKNLKTFVFNMNVRDGDLSECMNLSYVYSAKNRKHYNINNKFLPKGKYFRGNDNIEIWRRFE